MNVTILNAEYETKCNKTQEWIFFPCIDPDLNTLAIMSLSVFLTLCTTEFLEI